MALEQPLNNEQRSDLPEQMRAACTRLRRTPMPIADVIPLLLGGAYEIERLRSLVERLSEEHI